MTPDSPVPFVCRFGLSNGLAAKEFCDTLDGVPDDGRKYLIRCMAALCDMKSKECDREFWLLVDALCKLRDEWKERNPAKPKSRSVNEAFRARAEGVAF